MSFAASIPLSRHKSLAKLDQPVRRRWFSVSGKLRVQVRRSYLYVPSSSNRMLEKSLVLPSDIIIYDLEDSVSPSDKASARERLELFLGQDKAKLPANNHIAIRTNSLGTDFFKADISTALSNPSIRTIVLPKVNSVQDLHYVSREIYDASRARESARAPSDIDGTDAPISLVASIESARALWDVGAIASWTSEHGPQLGGKLSALLFAAEDLCADSGIVRTRSREELLYARSRTVMAAKAFGLEAIDMVCVDYKDKAYLREECEEGRRLGFTGKQAIHPDQVETIQSTFVPTDAEILRAARIVHSMAKAHASQIGAIGMDDGKGGKEMIDAPMLKQAERTVKIARAAGLKIPEIE